MKLTAGRWVLTIAVALLGHALLFAGIKTDDTAKVERAAGINIAVGSLSSFSEQIDAQPVDMTEPVETLETVGKDNSGKQVLESQTETQETVPPVVQQPDQSKAVTLDKIKPVVKESLAASEIKPDQITTTQVTQIQAEKTTPPVSVTPQSIVPVDTRKKITAVKVEKKLKRIKKKVRKKKTTKRKKTKVVKKTRRKNSAGSRTVASQRGGGGGGSQRSVSGRAALSNYKGKVRSRVAGRIRRSSGKRGRVVVRFTVTRGGSVSRPRIVSSSNSSLSRLAMAAVRGGFPSIPSGLPSRLTFTVPIRFR